MKNTLSTTSVARWGLYVAVVLGVAFVLFRTVELQTLESKVATLENQGRHLFVVQSRDETQPSRIERTSCEQIAENTGAVVAGGMSSVGEVTTAQFGTLQVLAGSTTLFPMLDRGMAIIGSELVQEPAGTEMNLLIDGVGVPVLVGESQPAGISTNNAIVVGLPPNDKLLEKCVVLVDQREHLEGAMPGLLSQLRVFGNPVIGVASFRDIFNPFEEYRERPSAIAGQAVGMLIGLITAFGTLRRSSEIAVYRLSGSSRGSVTIMLIWEAVICAAAFCGSAISALLVFRELDFATGAVLLETASAGVLIVLIAGCTATLILRRSPISLAKDR
ncbi:hypothetical protein ICM05_02810 [Leucobacter sp. cx-42]|uniref:hypothetical protein n=1 Tax=unclassified Leucobacter TaxID=2621730 RepID=UPI00165D7323|nr:MULTISPECIES: hypothetical protein [unclassified Leucobacter]MBC9953582.1 hypothetical protein [Leucobacter sp. cx-42]